MLILRFLVTVIHSITLFHNGQRDRHETILDNWMFEVSDVMLPEIKAYPVEAHNFVLKHFYHNQVL